MLRVVTIPFQNVVFGWFQSNMSDNMVSDVSSIAMNAVIMMTWRRVRPGATVLIGYYRSGKRRCDCLSCMSD